MEAGWNSFSATTNAETIRMAEERASPICLFKTKTISGHFEINDYGLTTVQVSFPISANQKMRVPLIGVSEVTISVHVCVGSPPWYTVMLNGANCMHVPVGSPPWHTVRLTV